MIDLTAHFMHFHHPNFIEQRSVGIFFVNAVPTFLVFRAPLLHLQFFKMHGVFRQSVVLNTQHKQIQNSLTVPLPLPALLYTSSHMHIAFFFQSAFTNMSESHKWERGRLNQITLDHCGMKNPEISSSPPHCTGKNRTVTQTHM